MPERWRDVGGAVGRLEPGPRNAITDVPGVQVGHAQASSGERSGVTVVAPPALPAAAGVRTVNGAGELSSYLEIDERGAIETPVYLCGTHAVGAVYGAAVTASGRGPDDVVIPVVGECDDGDMADSRTVLAADVEAALAALGEEVGEGTVGAGTGMSCFDFPGGIGTASRRVGGNTVGVLLLCNFGDREYLDLLGTRLEPAPARRESHGSCIAVCATDAPLSPHELRRLALRPLLGLARAGSYAAEGSGEIGLALATGPGSGATAGPAAGSASGAPAAPAPAPAAAPASAAANRALLNRCFAAAWEAAHEAVLNCLIAARPAERLDGSMQDAFPVERVRALARGRGLV